VKKSRAAIVAVLSPLLAYGVVVGLTDRVIGNTSIPAGKDRRAALAIRDNVTPFQKWGSKQFTQPYLNEYYDAAWYFTQSDGDTCKDAFLARLDSALHRYDEVDLYLLAHSNAFVDWVGELPADRRGHLRLVYNTGCRDLDQGPVWLGLGARAYVGHPGESASPIFYVYFLRRWTRGVPLRQAIDESNARMRGVLARTEWLSFGAVDAAQEYRESEAYCHGADRLYFAGGRD
jgi:hypothetical protein